MFDERPLYTYAVLEHLVLDMYPRERDSESSKSRVLRPTTGRATGSGHCTGRPTEVQLSFLVFGFLRAVSVVRRS